MAVCNLYFFRDSSFSIFIFILKLCLGNIIHKQLSFKIFPCTYILYIYNGKTVLFQNRLQNGKSVPAGLTQEKVFYYKIVKR